MKLSGNTYHLLNRTVFVIQPSMEKLCDRERDVDHIIDTWSMGLLVSKE